MSLGKKYGGAEKYTQTLVHNIDKTKYDVYCVVRKDSVLGKKLVNTNVSTLHLDISKRGVLNSILFLRKFVKDNRINIIHANGINAMVLILFISNKVKKIAVIHGDTYIDHKGMGFIKEILFPKIEAILCNKYDICIAVSESLKKILVHRGVKSEKIHVIYNGIEIYKYKDKYSSDSKIKLCAVGNLLPVKNHIKLLEAVKSFNEKYPDKYIYCDIYGSGECENNLNEYIKLNNLTNVTLKGFDDSIRYKLDQYDIFVQPSKYESFGLAVVEAINAGCFVIATDVGGMKEIIELFPKRGKLVQVNNSDAIMECINFVYSINNRVRHLDEEEEALLENKFSVRTMISQLERIYDDKNKSKYD